MSGHGGGKGESRRCLVPDFTDHHEIRVRTQRSRNGLPELLVPLVVGRRIRDRELRRALDDVLGWILDRADVHLTALLRHAGGKCPLQGRDRKSVWEGKSVSVGVDMVCARQIKKKTNNK